MNSLTSHLESVLSNGNDRSPTTSNEGQQKIPQKWAHHFKSQRLLSLVYRSQTKPVEHLHTCMRKCCSICAILMRMLVGYANLNPAPVLGTLQQFWSSKMVTSWWQTLLETDEPLCCMQCTLETHGQLKAAGFSELIHPITKFGNTQVPSVLFHRINCEEKNQRLTFLLQQKGTTKDTSTPLFGMAKSSI